MPHELRPVPVLNMTMDYLVTYIMDNQDRGWADWFEFLWNRTRAIRKVKTIIMSTTVLCFTLDVRDFFSLSLFMATCFILFSQSLLSNQCALHDSEILWGCSGYGFLNC